MTQGEKKRLRPKPLSLYPLSFDDAVTALLKTKPQPKTKKIASAKHRTAKPKRK